MPVEYGKLGSTCTAEQKEAMDQHCSEGSLTKRSHGWSNQQERAHLKTASPATWMQLAALRRLLCKPQAKAATIAARIQEATDKSRVAARASCTLEPMRDMRIRVPSTKKPTAQNAMPARTTEPAQVPTEIR
eukprot:CAMPEP_0172883082 /NCGR_PEP_ID=MMETSP1075-20121228/121832_1 /TAXON_ID=2916 /ORGANISM="Ceratium fusus, Strain PA161109" /LENGTH=131 /DNA_ID=CAMNT_0013735901 /DNA_START=767 /DNA_END=1164 /DNA_ORIENTATION=-